MPITTTIAIPKSIKRTAFRVDNPPPFPEDGSVAIAIAPILSSPSVGRIRKGVFVTAAAGIAVCVGGIGVSVGTGVWVTVGALMHDQGCWSIGFVSHVRSFLHG